jgi:hypothetical protein
VTLWRQKNQAIELSRFWRYFPVAHHPLRTRLSAKTAIIDSVRIQVQPFYGWGWSYRSGEQYAVPPPFCLDTEVIENGDFKTAIGRLDLPSHPLASMWIFLSPIRAGNTWNLSHLCAFSEQPSIPDDEEKIDVLGKVIGAANVTGFAHVELSTERYDVKLTPRLSSSGPITAGTSPTPLRPARGEDSAK